MENIAVVSVNKNKYSETFIHNQINLFPAKVHFFYGGYLPYYYNDGNTFLNNISSVNRISKYLSAITNKFNKKKLIDAIAKYCINNRIEAILAHYGPVGLNMVEISKKTDIPLYVYFHGYDVYRASELKIYGKHYHKIFQQAKKVFAVSEEMVKTLEVMGAPSSKVVYNPCGADTELFKFVDASANPPLFISVGRFDDTKDHSATIKAFKLVNNQYPETRLKLIGDGKNINLCKRLAVKLRLTDKVVFTGILNHEAVAFEMTKARVFVLHSVTTNDGDKEGAPVSIMEAGATGLPVVATNHAGINDIIIENETGFLVNENDIEDMANSMKRFIENNDLAKQMGKNAALRINEHFSLKRNVEVIWKALNEK